MDHNMFIAPDPNRLRFRKFYLNNIIIRCAAVVVLHCLKGEALHENHVGLVFDCV